MIILNWVYYRTEHLSGYSDYKSKEKKRDLARNVLITNFLLNTDMRKTEKEKSTYLISVSNTCRNMIICRNRPIHVQYQLHQMDWKDQYAARFQKQYPSHPNLPGDVFPLVLI